MNEFYFIANLTFGDDAYIDPIDMPVKFSLFAESVCSGTYIVIVPSR